jgi:NADH:ubiquinone reductase (H+-translocating)
VPLREKLDRTDLRLGRVTSATPAKNCIRVTTLEGHEEDIDYDHLIVTLGSVSRTLPVPGLAEHATGFKSLPEAIGLRNRLVRCLEMAETLEDPAQREAYLNFVFVGGGYAGVEGLAELQDFAADAIEEYPRCRTQGMRWVLVEAAERIMGEIAPDLAEFCMRELRGRGIEIRTRTTLAEVTATSARLSDGTVIPTRTVCWTAGVRPHPVVERLGLPVTDRGRIQVDSYMQVAGHENVWAIGDCAAVPDPAKKYREPCPPTCQHSLRQGRNVARNVAAAIGTGRRKKFTYRTLGVFVDLGRRKAVASTIGIKWRGTPAWLLARTYHLALMPGLGRKARLLVDWNVNLLFGRDLAELGNLGSLPALDGDTALEAHSSGGTTADGDRSAVTP